MEFNEPHSDGEQVGVESKKKQWRGFLYSQRRRTLKSKSFWLKALGNGKTQVDTTAWTTRAMPAITGAANINLQVCWPHSQKLCD